MIKFLKSFFFRNGNQNEKPGEEISRGGFFFPEAMAAAEDTYRTRDGEAFFDFRFVQNGYCFEIYVLSSPTHSYYCPREPSIDHVNGNGMIDLLFIECNMALRDYRQARKAAALWAEASWREIRKSGEGIDCYPMGVTA